MPSMISPAMGPHKYHVMSPVEQQQSYRSHPYAHHQRKNSDDRSRQNIQRPPHSPRAHPVQNHQPPRHPSLANGDVLAGFSNAGRLSPLPSPNALSPIDAASAAAAVMAASYDQGFYAGNMVGITTTTASTPTANTYGVIYQQQIDQSFQSQQLQQQQQQQQPHPYAQQSPYPQASFFHQPQAQMSSYRTTSPFPPSPLAPSPIQDSPQPPSPLDLSLGMSANFGSMGNSSHQNLSSLFDTSLSMGPHVQQQHQASFHRRELSGSSTHSSLSAASPAMSSQSNNDMSTGGVTGTMCATAANPTPLVVTTTNEDGTEVGVYYAVPTVNLNPGASDADLFQDFTMMDALGEDFVWVKNLFDKSTDSASMAPVGIKAEGAENRARAGSFSSAIPAGHVSESTSSMDDLHQDQWSSQYTPQSLQG
ncbi:hypothetical protein BC939DRAFT_267680 [Gamsiella multidivaricata]|uniref:uncharacterized protein n=1 Tax=Gamsiella multidivaricata TaxID=101098 RepID=UPI00221FAA86|nr:uncharacterized protein BC939DRAFT_267680 [Gamsiella multidivaricata]KAI7819209.1 hypothetical protein BC939DRAFT_267680 [Gamsiella multidivaricata]